MWRSSLMVNAGLPTQCCCAWHIWCGLMATRLTN